MRNDKTPDPDDQFPIVGIGASAGGLEAFKKFMTEIPEKTGMAFIFVQHLSPDHESLLPELLQKISKIPIEEIADNLRFQPDRLYLIPSNKSLTVVDGTLKLHPRDETRKLKTIDLFFSSLAVVHQSYAIGVVLSGAGSDGTLGLQVIKAHGGITFAQDQHSAAFDSMPKNAVKSGVVDFTLSPDKIAHRLIEINHPFHTEYTESELVEKVPETDNEILKQILSIIHVRKGVDFTFYKQTTIKRRFVRRMALNKIAKPSDYLTIVKESKTEVDDLYHDMLISVTDFFRDPNSFATLCNTVLPDLIKNKSGKETLRIWVAGCATGEEAYSIAMCLQEFLGHKGSIIKVQIFATDISETAITKARIGIYQQSELGDVSPARLARFFTKLDGSYQINKSIREMCIFAHHNLLTDPPFSKIDLVNCRNVLIYFDPVLQKKALSIFHYALNQKGNLMLGKSETIGSSTELFAPLHNQEKIYVKKGSGGKFMPVASYRTEQSLKSVDQNTQKFSSEFADLFKKAEEILLSKYTPAGVLVNQHMDIVQFRGETDLWLAPSPGKATLNLLKMARESLGLELRNAIHQAKTTHAFVSKENISVQVKGNLHLVTVEVIPLEGGELHFLVLFRENPLPNKQGGNKSDQPEQKGAWDPMTDRIKQLEKELSENRNEVRAILEEQEAANEELQSANEELLSGSEELQSLNEELETSKEELQSTNEELIAVNHELIDRNEQLNNARKYAEAIVSTIRDPLLILDNQLKIKSATEGFFRKFATTEKATEGLFLYELGNGQWNNPDLRNILENILPEKSSFSDFEITHTFPLIGTRTMLLNGRQLDRENAEQLMLLSIEDITDKRKAEEALNALKKSNDQLAHSNQELEQFASIASHDLQEPLRKIMTFVRIIEEKKLESNQDAGLYIQKIFSSAKRMDNLIKQLLNYSSISGNKDRFVLTDLNEVIQDILTDFELPITQKNAVIHKDSCPMIEAIPLQMNQLFFNLIGNALKFTKNDTVPVITISSKKLTKDQIEALPNLKQQSECYEIIVADNGIGFNQEFAEQIFIIFQRLNTDEQYQGTGIGLSLCRKIVLNHSGEIYAVSKENEGSAFHIILPARHVADQAVTGLHQ